MITNMEKYKSSGNLILIPKLEDYVRYTFQILVKIPRVEKFNIGSELKTSSLKMLENAHFLNKNRKNGYTYLNNIDALISYNKSMLRILNEEKSITKSNFTTSIDKLSEIGKIVGGLIKSNPK
ncbi:MAG: four helix bundle protein [Christensenellales bacterium]|jgi:hypothetical protein